MAKSKEIEALPDNSRSQLEKILKNRKEDHYNYEETVSWKCSTGSLLIDQAIGGHITPSLIRLCGPNNEGKTPMALEIVRNFHKEVKNSKTIWILAEGRLSKENKERCGMTFVSSPDEWTQGTVFLLESNVYELIVDIIKDLVSDNPSEIRYCFVIDSMDGLILKKDKEERGMEAGKVAGPQLITKKLLQALGLGMFKRGHLAIAISQASSDIKIDPYAKTTTRSGQFSGGNALLHWADFIFEFSPSTNSDYIFDSNDGKFGKKGANTIGKLCKITLQKSTIEKTRKHVVVYPVKFGKRPSGIWTELEIVDCLLMWELIESKGAWVTIDDSLVKELEEAGLSINKQYNGKDALKEFLEEHPEVTDFLYKKMKFQGHEAA